MSAAASGLLRWERCQYDVSPRPRPRRGETGCWRNPLRGLKIVGICGARPQAPSAAGETGTESGLLRPPPLGTAPRPRELPGSGARPGLPASGSSAAGAAHAQEAAPQGGSRGQGQRLARTGGGVAGRGVPEDREAGGARRPAARRRRRGQPEPPGPPSALSGTCAWWRGWVGRRWRSTEDWKDEGGGWVLSLAGARGLSRARRNHLEERLRAARESQSAERAPQDRSKNG